MPQLLLCSIVMLSIQIFNEGPAMFVVTCFFCHILCPSCCYEARNEQDALQVFQCTVLSISFVLVYHFFFYRLVHKVWIFEKFVFELEAFSCVFKIDCILVFQLISTNKKMVVSSGKFNIFFSWSPICTPLILVLASMKIASTL